MRSSTLQASAEFEVDTAASVRRVSTASVKPEDRFAFWNAFTSVHSDALIMPNTPTHDYRATATFYERDEVTVIEAVTDPLGYMRTPRHAANLRADRVRISYCADVDGGIESGGRAARITNGAVYFRDYRGPGHFWNHGSHKETWMFVPREWLVDSGPHVARSFDGAVFQDDPFLAMLMASRVRAVAKHANDAGFADAIRGLRTAIEDIFAARQSESHRKKLLVRTERLQRIKAYLTRHAGEPDLGPDRLADTLGLARSTLYRLLQEEGLQVNAHVAEYRLTAIARTLRDPAWAERPIGEIAGQWGHVDQAYFARAFKRQFGMTPSDYRAQGAIATKRAYF